MIIALAQQEVAAECDRVLESLPEWFGIPDARTSYALATSIQPTFVARNEGLLVGFISLKEHFPEAWEVHCMAVETSLRNNGIGRALLAAAENWLASRGTKMLQVKTLAATHPDPYYKQTRAFYERRGFIGVEVFPELWRTDNPCLLMVKHLVSNNSTSERLTTC